VLHYRLRNEADQMDLATDAAVRHWAALALRGEDISRDWVEREARLGLEERRQGLAERGFKEDLGYRDREEWREDRRLGLKEDEADEMALLREGEERRARQRFSWDEDEANRARRAESRLQEAWENRDVDDRKATAHRLVGWYTPASIDEWINTGNWRVLEPEIVEAGEGQQRGGGRSLGLSEAAAGGQGVDQGQVIRRYVPDVTDEELREAQALLQDGWTVDQVVRALRKGQ
jgi:hypothetical protein